MKAKEKFRDMNPDKKGFFNNQDKNGFGCPSKNGIKIKGSYEDDCVDCHFCWNAEVDEEN